MTRSNVPNDPIFKLVFPQPDMLTKSELDIVVSAISQPGTSKVALQSVAEAIRKRLNPHPAAQKEENVPVMDEAGVHGMQHKYHETLLFFPTEVCISSSIKTAMGLLLTFCFTPPGPILSLLLHVLLPVGAVYVGRIGATVSIKGRLAASTLHRAAPVDKGCSFHRRGSDGDAGPRVATVHRPAAQRPRYRTPGHGSHRHQVPLILAVSIPLRSRLQISA